MTMSFDWLDFSLIKTSQYSLTVGQFLTALTVLVVTFYLSKLVRDNLIRFSQRQSKVALSQIYALTRFLHYVLLFVGFVFALSILGIDTSKIALVAGALGVGVGLGLQDIVKNFVSGIVILVEKSLKVGDFIELESSVFGIVKEINFRSTVIRTNDNVDILIPNGELVTNRVINWTLEEAVARVRIPFSVAYGSDKDLVKKAALEAATRVSHTLSDDKHKPTVWFSSFGDSSLDFMLGVWVGYDSVIRPAALKSDYLWAIDDAFRKYGIEIPFPQRDVYIKKIPGSDAAVAAPEPPHSGS